MNRSSLPRLYDIDQNIGLIAKQAQGRTVEDLDHDVAFRYVVHHALMIIAEAVRHLPSRLKSKNSKVPWSRIVAMGNMIKHEYHRIDSRVVWDVAMNHLPALRIAITDLVRAAHVEKG